MFIDTHAHLYLEQFTEDIDTVIENAVKMNVQKIFLPNIDSSTTKAMLDLHAEYPENCYPMIGLHPCSVKENYRDELAHIDEELSKRRYYGIGETGIDLYWDTQFKSEQIECFEYQIELAKKLSLPVIIHSRESLDLTIELISKHQDGSLKGIFHCFNGTIDQCKKVCETGFMMGLGGVISYKNAKLDDMVRFMPMENMVLETDSPYLTPVPHRGKRNESSYIPLIASKVSEIRSIDLKTVMDQTTINAMNIFGIEV